MRPNEQHEQREQREQGGQGGMYLKCSMLLEEIQLGTDVLK